MASGKVVRVSTETAWRIHSEILALEWSRVDLTEGCIRLDGAHSKNGQPRTAYLSPATTRMLAEQQARVEATGRQLGRIINEVFIHTEKGPLQGKRQQEFNKAWRSACRKAGYTGVLLHDLRRSGSSGDGEGKRTGVGGAADFRPLDVCRVPPLRNHQRSGSP